MFLELRNLNIAYGDFLAVRDFDLQVSQGSFTCLLGPSGCGKSTLIRCLGGFIEARSGQIILEGRELTQAAEERPIATVFQSYALFPHMNVAENVAYGLRLRKVSKAEQKRQVAEMLERLNLTGYEHKPVHALSGGEQQRVALARSLIVQPSLLLLDEPLSNLDAKLRVSLRQELKRIQKDFAITTILVTHDQLEAFALGDQLVIMQKGRKIEEGQAEELYARPQEDFTREFLGDLSPCPLKDQLVRPESWILQPPGQGDLPVRILHKVFQGPLVYYDLQNLAEGAVNEAPLRCAVLKRSDIYLPEVGDLASLSLVE